MLPVTITPHAEWMYIQVSLTPAFHVAKICHAKQSAAWAELNKDIKTIDG